MVGIRRQQQLCVSLLRALLILALAGAFAFFAPHRAAAQVLYGSITGNITDAKGGAIPGATVDVSDQGTGLTRTGTTDAAGNYNFVDLQPGTYTVKVTQKGFKTYERRDLPVTENNVTRANVALEVGQVEQAVTVTGEAPILQTDRAEVHADVGSAELQNLPVPLGRNYQQVYRTLPGFSPPMNSHSIPTNPARSLEFTVNGTSDDQNNTRIDGVSSTVIQLPHIVSYIPALESIQEVNVVTNSFDAEQGLAGGAAINVQIKSGTNAIHGSAFEYHSDQHIKAWPDFTPTSVTAGNKPKLIYNQAGGTIGGPIKKDKLFYFVSYEGTFDHRSVQRRVTVPTDVMKNGDFQEFLKTDPTSGLSTCQDPVNVGGICLYNPYTGDPNTGMGRLPFQAVGDPRCDTTNNPNCYDIIPQQYMQGGTSWPIVSQILSLWPEPNLPGNSRNYFASGPFSFDRHTVDSKVNWNISSKANAFGRFSFLHYSDHVPTVFGDKFVGRPIGGSSNPGHGHGKTYSSTFGGTYTFTPTFLMDAYFGFTHQGTNSEQPGLGKNIGRDVLGIPGTNGTRNFESGWPEFDFNYTSDFATAGVDTNFMPYYRRDPQYQYVVNFNWIHGEHNVRFGADYYRQGLNQTQAEFISGGVYGAQGGFDFGEGVTANPCVNPPVCDTSSNSGRANSFASFLLGIPDAMGKTLQVPDQFTWRSNLYSTYIRDRWNLTPRLTLDYGVRWEYFPYPFRADRGLERYDINTNQVLICGMGSVPSNCGVDISKTMFAPRLGVAYRATNTFVIRAGYGITNDPYQASELTRNGYPVMVPYTAPENNSFTPALFCVNGVCNNASLAQGLPPQTVPGLDNGVIPIPTDVDYEGFPQKIRRGYVQSWNLSVQKELGMGFTGQAGYVATRSTRMSAFVDLNAGQVIGAGDAGRPLLQQFGRTAATVFSIPVGTNMFDSLQTSLQRRFTNGLMLNVNYTWGKAIGIVDNSDWTPNVQALAYMNRNRAPLTIDRTQNLEMTNVWELPFGRSKRWLADQGPLTAVVSGWQVNNIVSVISGPPFTVYAASGALKLPGTSNTADQLGPVKKLGGIGDNAYYYDPFAFADVFATRFGNMGYDSLRGPGLFNWDFGLFRDFTVGEGKHLQLRFESFNFTNTPHFDIPDQYLSDANSFDSKGHVTDPGSFMTITNTISLAREGLDERQFRVGLRFSF